MMYIVAKLCQMQIFFSLLSSVALQPTANPGTNIDVLLVVLWCVPVGLALLLQSPLLVAMQEAIERWRAEAESAGEEEESAGADKAGRQGGVRPIWREHMVKKMGMRMVKKTGLSALDAQAGNTSGIGMVQLGGLASAVVEERGAQQQEGAGVGVDLQGEHGRQSILQAAQI